MKCDFLSSFASWAATSLVAETSPNCSTRTLGWAVWMAATAASGLSTSFSTCSSVPGIVKFTTTERPSLETVLTRVGGIERALDLGDALDPLQAADDVRARRPSPEDLRP